MKIYGDYSFVLDRLNVMYESRIQIAQNGTKIVEFADKFIEEQKAVSQDQVAISKEGMDYIRDQLSDLSSGTKFETEGERTLTQITNANMSLMDGLCKTYISLRLDSVDEDGISTNIHRDLASPYWQEMNGRDMEDWSSHAECLVNSYESLYKRIVEGYADGTREVWIQDNSTGDDFSGIELEVDGQAVRYRKLTREEELEYLDKTFDKLLNNEADRFARVQRAKEIAEAKAKEYEESMKDSDGFDALAQIAKDLVKEAKVLLERVKQKLEELLNTGEPEIDIQGRMEIEAYNHRMETVARGKQQSQYANYKRISQMTSDMKTLLGTIRA